MRDRGLKVSPAPPNILLTFALPEPEDPAIVAAPIACGRPLWMLALVNSVQLLLVGTPVVYRIVVIGLGSRQARCRR